MLIASWSYIMKIFEKIMSAFGKVWLVVRLNFMFMLTMYVLGIIVAYATLPSWKGAEIYDNIYYELFFDLFFICLFLSILPRRIRPWIRNILYIIAYSLAIIDVFCFVKFDSTISPSMLLLVGETTASETSEFFETYLTWDMFNTPIAWPLILLLVHVAISLCYHFRKKVAKRIPYINNIQKSFRNTGLTASNTNQSPSPWGRKGVGHLSFKSAGVGLFEVLLSLLVILLLYFGWEDTMKNKEAILRVARCETIGDVEKAFNVKPNPVLYQPVYRLAFSIQSNHLISLQLDRMKQNTENVTVDSCSFLSPNIVVIIGESYNKYHSQLYGYEKNTTPRQVEMEKTGRLTKFTDVIAPWNLTSFVFKHLMTTYCYGDEGDWCDYPLFCQLFRKAGYNVRFLTNQFLPHAKDAVYDFSGGFFLNDEKLGKAQFDIRNEQTHLWDEDLLKDYERLAAPGDSALYASGKGTLSIFHLMGQHVSYRIRCPRSKQHFSPQDYDLPDNTPKEKRNIAYYDCAVWYNDSVVDRIVDRFKNEEAIILYFPDHGEEVYGPGSLHSCGRKHTTAITRNIAQQEYEIPMWIYCTDKYKTAHPEVVKAVMSAADKPFMIDAMSHLLLGLAGIKTEYYKPKYDLLHPEYDVKRPRFMQHAVDYNELMKKE